MRNEGIVELYAPRHSLIGSGSINEIPRFLKKMEAENALVITDIGLVKMGTADKVTQVLAKAGLHYTVYDGVKPNPTVAIVNEAMAAYNQNHCKCIIAIGGGSPIDVGKAVSLLAANGGTIQDYWGENMTAKQGVPMIAVNTTAGTGSEVTRAYVVTDEETKIKMLDVDTNCLPFLAIDDPDLMTGMPPMLTAATGMDALTHAIEAYLCNVHTPYTDGLALQAIKLVSDSLRNAVTDATYIRARTDMCWAAYMAGLAFSNAGLGLVHGIAHQLGGFYNIPHGLANAIMLPFVMEYNREHCLKRMCDIAYAMGEKINTHNMNASSHLAIEAVRNLSSDIQIPTLDSTAFKIEDAGILAEHALQDGATAANLVIPKKEDVVKILLQAYAAGPKGAKMLKERGLSAKS